MTVLLYIHNIQDFYPMHSMPPGLDDMLYQLICNFVLTCSDSTTDYEKEHIIAGEILWTLVCGSPPLHQLQPPAQALLQCAVTRWLGKLPGLKELSDVQLEIIARVPLLHAGVYTALLNRASRLGGHDLGLQETDFHKLLGCSIPTRQLVVAVPECCSMTWQAWFERDAIVTLGLFRRYDKAQCGATALHSIKTLPTLHCLLWHKQRVVQIVNCRSDVLTKLSASYSTVRVPS